MGNPKDLTKNQKEQLKQLLLKQKEWEKQKELIKRAKAKPKKQTKTAWPKQLTLIPSPHHLKQNPRGYMWRKDHLNQTNQKQLIQWMLSYISVSQDKLPTADTANSFSNLLAVKKLRTIYD